MFVRIVWQESRSKDLPDLFRDASGTANRGSAIFPGPGSDFRHMTQGLFDRCN